MGYVRHISHEIWKGMNYKETNYNLIAYGYFRIYDCENEIKIYQVVKILAIQTAHLLNTCYHKN